MKYIKLILGQILFFVLFSIYFSSCTFDNEEELLEGFICDTTELVYDDLTYIFTDICYECHKEGDTYREGIKMDDFENVRSSINTGKVLPAIKHEGPYNMPFNQPKLSDCDIQKIEAWINDGMPEK